MAIVSKATVRRGVLWLAVGAATLAALIAGTGGFTLRIAGVVISAQHSINPLVAAIVALIVAAWMARPHVDVTLIGDLRRIRHVAPSTWLLVFGTGLRLWYWAAARPLWLDEEMIALNIRDRGFADLTGPLWLGQSAPLGWLWSERLAITLLGLGEAGLRALPVVFGVATLVAAWRIGRRWLSVVGASVLTFLVAIGPWIFSNAIELKHYSADTFFGLLLPALVIWAIEGAEPGIRTRRAATWWAAAILGCWLSMGGLLVAPACAIVLIITLWRRDGLVGALRAGAGGVVWLGAFALHYSLSLQFATSNRFLYDVWANWLAPVGAGPIDRLIWLITQAAPYALKPGGTSLALLFWSLAILGFAFARPRALGVMFALIPASAAALALLRIVPLFERLAIWSLPAVYAGVALSADAAWQWARHGDAASRVRRLSAATALAIAIAIVCGDIARVAAIEIPGGHDANSNHSLNDREAVAWLARQMRPGDVVFTTALAKPAVWWYGGVRLNGRGDPDPEAGTSFLGAPILELTFHVPPCDAGVLPARTEGHSRAHIFLGFRFDDVPDTFDDVVRQRFRQLGIVETKAFAGVSQVMTVRFGTPDPRIGLAVNGTPEVVAPGCLGVKPAARW